MAGAVDVFIILLPTTLAGLFFLIIAWFIIYHLQDGGWFGEVRPREK